MEIRGNPLHAYQSTSPAPSAATMKTSAQGTVAGTASKPEIADTVELSSSVSTKRGLTVDGGVGAGSKTLRTPETPKGNVIDMMG